MCTHQSYEFPGSKLPLNNVVIFYPPSSQKFHQVTTHILDRSLSLSHQLFYSYKCYKNYNCYNRYFCLCFSSQTNIGVATNGEEYVPVIVPISRVRIKNLIVDPPIIVSANNIKTIVIELFRDRTIVSVTALFEASSIYFVSPSSLYSRILSKITIVSWTEKDIVVKTAVTNIVSTSAPKKWPNNE